MSKNENKYKISVVIPTLNRINTLQRALDSVINQTYKPAEIIVVDNGSSDGTLKFLSCLLYTSPSPRDGLLSRMPSSA